MSEQQRAADDPPPFPATDDELAARITRALHARAAAQHPDLDDVAARLRAAARDAPPAPVRALHRGGKIVAAGVVTGTLAIAGAGAAAATNPYSDVARAVEGAVQAAGIDWSPMPEGYSRDQYDTYWDAYGIQEAQALSELWQVDVIEAKARAGQMLLEGQAPPVDEALLAAPGVAADMRRDDELAAFWAAGYTIDDLRRLMTVWEGEELEVKARVGRTLLDGGEVPVPPSGASRDDGPARPADPSRDDAPVRPSDPARDDVPVRPSDGPPPSER
ncbi:hypothetical protein [Cellulomonas shaoxiangyii]|uniref:Uncharacterized protein n=1 Tax=Cellulomonas shaoxiangyii TaxID=2566013 RepID=A0A4P7SF30_9CELL|nr:hypothetical protein [Cellulomonas shaoxiangyii]QCB92470.1 hypothetical protein E5225_01770 [Cellulomonas shaoxiangyii]TGY84978.1 hypothetical protein E5226_08880 [Cellulomonas shaoxiangyii]